MCVGCEGQTNTYRPLKAIWTLHGTTEETAGKLAETVIKGFSLCYDFWSAAGRRRLWWRAVPGGVLQRRAQEETRAAFIGQSENRQSSVSSLYMLLPHAHRKIHANYADMKLYTVNQKLFVLCLLMSHSYWNFRLFRCCSVSVCVVLS